MTTAQSCCPEVVPDFREAFGRWDLPVIADQSEDAKTVAWTRCSEIEIELVVPFGAARIFLSRWFNIKR